MPEEEIDVATDTNVDVEEATNSNENSDQEDTVALKEKLDSAEKAKSQLTARAKKAEEELKKLRESQTNPPIKNDPQLSEELKLIARGLSDEEIEKAKVIAKGNGTSLQDALKDDMFIAYQTKLKEDKRKENAKLGASKGSGETQTEPLIKQDMTRDEHQKAFKKAVGN